MDINNIIYSFVIGDSFGLSKLDNNNNINTIKDNNIKNIPSGSISSLSSFMLATIDSLSINKKVDSVDILNKMCTTLICGKYTTDRKVYDLDNSTYNVLDYYVKKNNLNYSFNDDDLSSYSISRIIPFIIYSYYKKEDLNDIISLISITNINEDVLLGIYIYYKYILNLINTKDKIKSLKIDIPSYFKLITKHKYKSILKGNIYFNEIEFDDNIYNVLKIIFYVILNTNSMDEIFTMINNFEGNTNIYFSLIFVIASILYDNKNLDKLKSKIKNKKDINKYINSFKRSLL